MLTLNGVCSFCGDPARIKGHKNSVTAAYTGQTFMLQVSMSVISSRVKGHGCHSPLLTHFSSVVPPGQA